MAEKKKVLLVVNTISSYRAETYNIIGKHFDFTVGYNVADQTQGECNFKKIKFDTRKIGPFTFFGKAFWKECRKYDAVITLIDLHNFEFAIVPFVKRPYKLLTWSIGFRCSYTRPFDVNRKITLLDRHTYRMLQAADANIFYMEKAKEFWTRTKLDLTKVFVAPNTTTTLPIDGKNEKTSILFVGTLYQGKGVDKLITAFGDATKGSKSNITLDIVGKGEEREALERLTESLGLSDKVRFHGAIYDESVLARLFAKALLCVSPTQAGLTVPKSMGYGVPMVTKRYAITGGEIYHIKNGENGILYDRDEELPEILRLVISDPLAFEQMGKTARKYYMENAQPKHQAQGVIGAINFAMNEK